MELLCEKSRFGDCSYGKTKCRCYRKISLDIANKTWYPIKNEGVGTVLNISTENQRERELVSGANQTMLALTRYVKAMQNAATVLKKKPNLEIYVYWLQEILRKSAYTTSIRISVWVGSFRFLVAVALNAAATGSGPSRDTCSQSVSIAELSPKICLGVAYPFNRTHLGRKKESKNETIYRFIARAVYQG